MHDFIVKRAVDFVPDLLLHSLRAPATNARHFYSCFQACILPPNFLTGSLRTGKLHRCSSLARILTSPRLTVNGATPAVKPPWHHLAH